MLSPQPEVVQETYELYPFSKAIVFLISGSKIARVSWNNTDYGFLRKAEDDTWLSIHKNGEDFTWKVNEADLTAIDWFVLKEN